MNNHIKRLLRGGGCGGCGGGVAAAVAAAEVSSLAAHEKAGRLSLTSGALRPLCRRRGQLPLFDILEAQSRSGTQLPSAPQRS